MKFAFLYHSHWLMPICLIRTGPCLTTGTWRCHKNFSQWEHTFHWKLCCHCLKFLWQRQIAVVRQGPGWPLLGGFVNPYGTIHNSIQFALFVISYEMNLKLFPLEKQLFQQSLMYHQVGLDVNHMSQCLQTRWASTTCLNVCLQTHSCVSHNDAVTGAMVGH